MGAVTTGQVGSKSAHAPCNGKRIHAPSLLRVHARDICAMLRLRFLASSSTLAAAVGKVTGHAI